ncbi:Putative glucose-6-phosphate 1-epimerase [Geodia barretti]|uniref:glucose-6-phosphate 1-epimerase n=1 Tax=Geodia barretti TaxID=519541 RepID=A0AA35S1E0_GEOBA|nr:Putative glucose-6-phosphate 1-epimerase [Geodia barretti]
MMAAEQEVVVLTRDENNKATVNLHGGTLQSWVHNGTEMIFVSKNAVFDNKKGIRGGIPVVFPQFGPWELGPQHGFARTSRWQCTSPPSTNSGGDVSATFTLTDTDATRAIWNHKFKLDLVVVVKAGSLDTSLTATNNNDAESFSFTCLLHTYFSLPDVTKSTVSGLGGLTYIDKTAGGEKKQETEDPKTVSKYVDYIYLEAVKDHVITNAAGGKTICLKKTNLPDTVGWNPWSEKAKAMSDFGDDQYPTLVCEAAMSAASRPLSWKELPLLSELSPSSDRPALVLL